MYKPTIELKKGIIAVIVSKMFYKAIMNTVL